MAFTSEIGTECSYPGNISPGIIGCGGRLRGPEGGGGRSRDPRAMPPDSPEFTPEPLDPMQQAARDYYGDL